MAEKRTRRPRQVEQLLRQEARYGCCKCGHPIFQYHHIVRYTEEDPHYRPEDMMVLCPNCHDEATQGVLSESEQRKLKADSYNLQHGYAEGQLAVKQQNARIVFGDSVAMVAQGSLLEIDGESLLGLTLGPDGDLRVSVDLYDQDDNEVARIIENVWEAGAPSRGTLSSVIATSR